MSMDAMALTGYMAITSPVDGNAKFHVRHLLDALGQTVLLQLEQRQQNNAPFRIKSKVTIHLQETLPENCLSDFLGMNDVERFQTQFEL